MQTLCLLALVPLVSNCGSAEQQDIGERFATGPLKELNIPLTAAPEGASIAITAPADGAVVSSPVAVKFAAENVKIRLPGTFYPGSGHYHLLIDTDAPSATAVIPADAQHLDLIRKETEIQLELSPGSHTLQLLLGDGNHVPHDPPVLSEKITITVQ